MKEREKAKRTGDSVALKKKSSSDKEKRIQDQENANSSCSKLDNPKIRPRSAAKRISKTSVEDKERRELRRVMSFLAKEHIALSDISKTLRFLKKQETKLADFLFLARKVEEMERRYGKPYQSILEDYAEKSELLEKAKATLEETGREEKEIQARLQDLKALERLQSFLEESQAGAGSLSSYIKQYKEFVKLGFDLDTMTLLVDELVRQGFDPAESGKIVGSWLTKSRTIAEAMLRAEQSLDAIKKEESLTISRIESLVRKAEESQKKIDALESYYTSRSRSLESEYENRQRALNVRISEERRRAEAETFEILRERDKLRSENRILKEEEGSMKKELDLARSISQLIRNPRGLSPSQLETITLELGRIREVVPLKGSSEPKAQERLLEARRQFLQALKETVNA